MARTTLILAAVIVPIGCHGDARIELAAADSIDALAASLGEVLMEYHTDLERSDDARERAAASAFAARLRADIGNDAEADAHIDSFLRAMERLRSDRHVEWQRHSASFENLMTLHEVAQGLRRVALETLSLGDEARRYIDNLSKLANKAGEPRGDAGAP